MITYTGESVWPKNKIAPSLESVAVALSRIPRFCGHTRDWYSVLCHTFVVSELMPEKLRIHGLLHDAPESCVSDVPTPWKTQAARKREQMILERLYDSLNIDLPDPQELIALSDADHLALAAEAHVIGHPKAQETWPNPNPRAVLLTEGWVRICMPMFKSPPLAIRTYMDAIEEALTQVPEKAQV